MYLVRFLASKFDSIERAWAFQLPLAEGGGVLCEFAPRVLMVWACWWMDGWVRPLHVQQCLQASGDDDVSVSAVLSTLLYSTPGLRELYVDVSYTSHELDVRTRYNMYQ